MHFIKEAVLSLTTRFGTRDPFELANQLNFLIIYFPFKKVKGLMINLFGYKIIGINSHLPEELFHVVVAHEIGHDQLHPTRISYFYIVAETFFNDKFEHQANQFAAELIIGDDRPSEGESIEVFAKKKRIPVELVRLLMREY